MPEAISRPAEMEIASPGVLHPTYNYSDRKQDIIVSYSPILNLMLK